MVKMRLLLAIAVGLLVTAVPTPAKQPPVAALTYQVSAERIAGLPDFVDGVVAQQIATREVAGAVVTVVYRGRVLFTRGYGMADVDRGVPVDAARTLFRPGSVSKMFTWTALLQQVEQGRVSLDADVNTYLDYRIPDYKGQPIRVRDLLSHTPGMSDRSDIVAASPDKLVYYAAWLKTHMPQRLWAPGIEVSYSNYGARRLHRRTRFGRAIPRLCSKPHLQAAGDDLDDVPGTLAACARTAHGDGLPVQGRQADRAAVRAVQPDHARRIRNVERGRHEPFYAGDARRRPTERRTHPEA
jgi:hypothetical protein